MQPFYLRQDDRRFLSQHSTGSPWGPQSQHGGPPGALLTRAVEEVACGAERTLGRVTMELLGPVPLRPLEVGASVVRRGRSVELVEATMYDEAAGRLAARASAWTFPLADDGPSQDLHPLPHGPEEGVTHPRPSSWFGGYLDAVDWRWVRGAVEEPGPAVVWMRPRVALVAGEEMSPLQRLMACVDSASGVSAELDPGRWGFLNTELTVHVLRPPVGEWLCLDAETTLGPGRVGLATSDVYDARGLVARSAQALLVVPR